MSRVQAVEIEYRDNPYHNATHAADVVQTLGSMLLSEGFREGLTAMEVLAMLIAAACHDVGHPGPCGCSPCGHVLCCATLGLEWNTPCFAHALYACKVAG